MQQNYDIYKMCTKLFIDWLFTRGKIKVKYYNNDRNHSVSYKDSVLSSYKKKTLSSLWDQSINENWYKKNLFLPNISQ